MISGPRAPGAIADTRTGEECCDNRHVRRAPIPSRSASLITVAVLACGASGSIALASTESSGVPFSVSATRACLLREPAKFLTERKVNFALGRAPTSSVEWVRRYSRLPVVGELQILGLGHMDSGDLFFFDTSDHARSGTARLFDFWVYGRGQPAVSPATAAVLKSMGLTGPTTPPTADAAAQLHQIYDNVVVIWSYPRHHPLVSSQTIRACL